MDRRESLKILFVGGVSSTFLLHSCVKDKETLDKELNGAVDYEFDYGRTPEEKKRIQQLMDETFFTDEELETITVLVDIILPKGENSKSASEVGVPDFIEFIAKDMPYHQTPLRGGISWMNRESRDRFSVDFKAATREQQLTIVDDIAYPYEAKKEHQQGVTFFNLMRDLTLTGFYTTETGVKEIGYKGNTPNAWDGPPEEVLKKHGVSIPEKYKDKYIKPEERNDIMVWEEHT